MAYATTSQVQAEFNELNLSGVPSVTTAEIDSFLDQESAYMDAFLKMRYTLPIVGTAALALLQKLCVALVAYRVAKILQIAPITYSPDGRIEQKNGYLLAHENALKTLLDLKIGKLLLPDADVANYGGLAYVEAETSDLEAKW